MRKHLLEHLKTRKVFGARIAAGDAPKTIAQLQELGMGPQVYVFKNLFSGQILYSQVPAWHQDLIDQQFVRPNWENRKPSRRNDLWRIMCVADFDNYEYAEAAYNGLLQLKKLRDTDLRQQSKESRHKNEDMNDWYSGQYRPHHAQEAVADLAHVVDAFELENTTLLWENVWRKGDDEHWRVDLVDHDTLPPFNPRDQTVMLDELRLIAVEEFRLLREQEAKSQGEQQSEESTPPLPTA